MLKRKKVNTGDEERPLSGLSFFSFLPLEIRWSPSTEDLNMSTLLYAVSEIKAQIPFDILKLATYIDEPPELANLTTVEDKLIKKVLRKRVLVDANMSGGMEVIVPLTTLTFVRQDHYYAIYQIDREYTMGRNIISALGIAPLPSMTGLPYSGIGSNTVYGCRENPLMAVANRIGSAAAPDVSPHTAHIEVIGPNTILVNSYFNTNSNLGLRCIIENDEDLNNIQPRSRKAFSYLCVLATKAYIYNRLIVPISSGQLQFGQELGVVKDIVSSYESAEEDYRTYLKEVWAKVAYMNDVGRYNKLVRSMLSPGL